MLSSLSLTTDATASAATALPIPPTGLVSRFASLRSGGFPSYAGEMPNVIVTPFSVVTDFYLFVADCSSAATIFSPVYGNELKRLETVALSAGPAGTIQTGCICFAEHFSYTDSVPPAAPVLSGATADFLLLASLLNQFFMRIKKSSVRVHIVLATGAMSQGPLNASEYPQTNLQVFTRIVLKRPTHQCRFVAICVGTGAPLELVSSCLLSTLSTGVDWTRGTPVMPLSGVRSITAGGVILQEHLFGTRSIDGVDTPLPLRTMLSHLHAGSASYRRMRNQLQEVRHESVDHESVSEVIMQLTGALRVLSNAKDLVGMQANDSGMQAYDSALMLACDAILDGYMITFRTWRTAFESMNARRRFFVQAIRDFSGLVICEHLESQRYAVRYHSLNAVLLRKSLLTLFASYPGPDASGLDDVYEDLSLSTFRSVVAEAQSDGLAAMASVHNAYTLAKFIPIPVRTLYINQRPDGTAICPWLVAVHSLPTVVKFISVGDFFGRPRTAFDGHTEKINSFIPLPCSAMDTYFMHTLATAAVTGDPELYHPDALAALVAAVICCVTCEEQRSLVPGGFWWEEMDRSITLYRGAYPVANHTSLAHYMSDVCCDDLYRSCLSAQCSLTESHRQCPALSKFLLGIALGGAALDFDQFRARYLALVLEYLGRNRLPRSPFKVEQKNEAFGALAAPLLAEYTALSVASKYAHYRDAANVFKGSLRAVVAALTVGDVFEPMEVLLPDTYMSGVQGWGRCMARLYVYTRADPSTVSVDDAIARMALQTHELASLVTIVTTAGSSSQRHLVAQRVDMGSHTFSHPVMQAAFGMWKVEFEAHCIAEFERIYAKDSARLHESVALHVPLEYELTLLLATGVNAGNALQLTQSGLSTTRCMCKTCPFFLADLEVDATAKAKAKNRKHRVGMSEGLASHLRYCPVIPGLHRTVVLVPPSTAPLETFRGEPISSMDMDQVTPCESRGSADPSTVSPTFDPAVLRVLDGTHLRTNPVRLGFDLAGLRSVADTTVRRGVANCEELEMGFLAGMVESVRQVGQRWPFEEFAADVLGVVGQM